MRVQTRAAFLLGLLLMTAGCSTTPAEPVPPTSPAPPVSPAPPPTDDRILTRAEQKALPADCSASVANGMATPLVRVPMRPVSGVTAGSCEVVHDVNAYGWVVNAVAADCSDPALAAEAERAVSLWAFGPRNAYNRITPACGVRTRIAYPLR